MEKEGCRSLRPSSRSSLCLLEPEMARNRGHAAAKRRDELGGLGSAARETRSPLASFSLSTLSIFQAALRRGRR